MRRPSAAAAAASAAKHFVLRLCRVSEEGRSTSTPAFTFNARHMRPARATPPADECRECEAGRSAAGGAREMRRCPDLCAGTLRC